jgi:hypothetical protein
VSAGRFTRMELRKRSTWADGVARVLRTDGRVLVHCPFCEQTHRHERSALGSREVIAGCHVGYGRCRSYAVPQETIS